MNAILVIMLAATILLAGCTAQGQVDEVQTTETMNKKPEQVQAAGQYSGKVLAGTTSIYLDFNQEDYQKALAENKIILLNFYANWCPVCKAEEPEAIDAFMMMQNPEVIGFRINYRDSDTDKYETELAKKFGVSYQHTKVIIVNGERVLKSPESWESERYAEELGKY